MHPKVLHITPWMLTLALVGAVSPNLLNAGSTAPPPSAAGPAADEKTGARIEAFVRQFHDEGLFNGVVLVAEHGRPVLAKGYGFANIEWSVPNTVDTKFRIASLTKQFTALLALQLVAEHRLDLDKTVSDYLPAYPRDNGARITVHQLLNHTAGIPEYTWTGDLIDAQTPVRPDEFIKRFWAQPLMFEPGTGFSYSNSGYYVLGVILERITGRSYEELLHERVLDPLGMTDTGYDHVEDVLPRRATGYLRVFGGRENPRYRYVDPARQVVYRAASDYELPIYRDMVTLYAAGAMYSTAGDLLKWDRALAEGRLLPAALYRTWFRAGRGNYGCGLFTARVPVPDVGAFFDDFEGYRPAADDRRPRTTVQYHTGSVNGFISSIARFPDEDRVVILLNNTGMTRLPELNAGIVSILHGVPALPPRHSIAERVARTMVQDGVAQGRAEYAALRARRDEDYFVSANEIATLADSLQRLGRTKESVALLELGSETFPDSVKCLDRLAAAYDASGNAESARASSKKLLLQLAADKRLSARERDELRRAASERLTRLDGNDRNSSAGDARRVGSPNG